MDEDTYNSFCRIMVLRYFLGRRVLESHKIEVTDVDDDFVHFSIGHEGDPYDEKALESLGGSLREKYGAGCAASADTIEKVRQTQSGVLEFAPENVLVVRIPRHVVDDFEASRSPWRRAAQAVLLLLVLAAMAATTAFFSDAGNRHRLRVALGAGDFL